LNPHNISYNSKILQAIPIQTSMLKKSAHQRELQVPLFLQHRAQKYSFLWFQFENALNNMSGKCVYTLIKHQLWMEKPYMSMYIELFFQFWKIYSCNDMMKLSCFVYPVSCSKPLKTQKSCTTQLKMSWHVVSDRL